jgi:7-cyano-7-deazaguanine synthase in queuosine biosynthesis
MNNPILNEVRVLRNEHAKQFNYDVIALSLDYDKRHDEIMQRFNKIKKDFSKSSSLDYFSLSRKKCK